MPPVRFVHAADLHLDSPFQGLADVSPEIQQHLRQSTLTAFDKIIQTCVDHEVDFLVLAGDVYDVADTSLRAQVHLRNGLARLAEQGIPAFVAHGNHDHCQGWRARLDWPPEVHFFPPGAVQMYPVERAGETIAHIHGTSFPQAEVRDNLAPRFQRAPGAPFSVGVLHANVGGDSNHDNYAPCQVEDLARTGLDYWALGHVHSRRILQEREPAIVYPGNPQGRNPRETGARGCYLVNVTTAGEVQTEFVPTDTVRWHQMQVSIAAIATDQDLLDLLQSEAARVREEAAGCSAVIRYHLHGRGSLHHHLQRKGFVPDLLAQMRPETAMEPPFTWVESIRISTGPVVDRDALQNGDDLLGEFLQLAAAARTDPRQLEALRVALSDLFEHERARRYLTPPTDAELREWLAAAEDLGIDLLLDEEA